MENRPNRLKAWIAERERRAEEKNLDKVPRPFWVITKKEIADHIHSWRFIILLAIIFLTCMSSLYSAMTAIRGAGSALGGESFFFLRLFTLSDGTLPSYLTFVGFLGPLLGIAMGFDAINSERNKGTLSRIMSQPIHRDMLLNAKFVAALVVISAMFFTLSLLVLGFGIFTLGIPPMPEEIWRLVAFNVLIVFYVGFWLNLSMIFSVRFRQPATSALSGIAVWLFFTVFFSMLMNLVANALKPSAAATTEQVLSYLNFMQFLYRLSPSQLFTDATVTLLVPETNTLNSFLSLDQLAYSIPGTPLSFGQSLLVVWPQVTGLFAATLICFAISYVMFMRQEIRSRS
jgi:ABC-2 type transport system permease protein